MTDKQRGAIKIVLQQCLEKDLDIDAALILIDAILDNNTIQLQPTTYPLDYPPKVWYQDTYTDTDKKETGGEAKKRSMLLNNTSPF